MLTLSFFCFYYFKLNALFYKDKVRDIISIQFQRRITIIICSCPPLAILTESRQRRSVWSRPCCRGGSCPLWTSGGEGPPGGTLPMVPLLSLGLILRWCSHAGEGGGGGWVRARPGMGKSIKKVLKHRIKVDAIVKFLKHKITVYAIAKFFFLKNIFI